METRLHNIKSWQEFTLHLMDIYGLEEEELLQLLMEYLKADTHDLIQFLDISLGV